MILDDGLNVLPPLGFGVDPDEEGVASPASSPERGRRDETPATASTAATPSEAGAGTSAGSDADADAAETTTATATDTDTDTDTTEETE